MNDWPSDGQGMSRLPDVIALAHNHCAEVASRATERGTVWGARMGSFQYTSRFTRQKGWAHSPPTCPTFILPPVRAPGKNIIGFDDYRVAYDALARGLGT